MKKIEKQISKIVAICLGILLLASALWSLRYLWLNSTPETLDEQFTINTKGWTKEQINSFALQQFESNLAVCALSITNEGYPQKMIFYTNQSICDNFGE